MGSRIIVYICSPLRGDIQQNVQNAEKFSKYVYEQGGLPIAPHAIFSRFLDDTVPTERKAGMEMGMQLLALCEEVWVFGETVSEGMASEIAWAREHNKTIRYFSSKAEARDGNL